MLIELELAHRQELVREAENVRFARRLREESLRRRAPRPGSGRALAGLRRAAGFLGTNQYPLLQGLDERAAKRGAHPVGRDSERSEKMFNTEIARQDFGPIEGALGALPRVGGRRLAPLLANWEVVAALAREQEHAAIEAEDVLSQADEALVMG